MAGCIIYVSAVAFTHSVCYIVPPSFYDLSLIIIYEVEIKRQRGAAQGIIPGSFERAVGVVFRLHKVKRTMFLFAFTNRYQPVVGISFIFHMVSKRIKESDLKFRQRWF